MKPYKTIRSMFLFLIAAVILCVIPVCAADETVQSDYDLNVSALPAEQGDILTIRAGDAEYVYAVSNKLIRGLDVSDTRSYAGDFSAVAGVEKMMLTFSDPACEGICADGSWKEVLDADNAVVIFNGEEQDFSGDELVLECAFGELVLNKDGSICFKADADARLVTVSQRCGDLVCSVSLQRTRRQLPKDSTVEVILREREKADDRWTYVPLPAGMAVDPDSLSWNHYVQFSAANGDLFCRQTKEIPLEADPPGLFLKNSFTLVQKGSLTASADWDHDVRNCKKIVRFNGAGHAYGTPDTVTDGTFALHLDRWYYTADDSSAGAFQFTNQQRGQELIAAVGRGETPAYTAPGGETLAIESNGNTFTHTMQRLSRAEGNKPLTCKLTTYLYIIL